MCGIAGVVQLGSRHVAPDAAVAAMLDAIGHRGPDARAVRAVDRDVVLGACRLVIVDTSDGGNQPMASEDGIHHLVLNGEVYDHEQQRAQLIAEGERFRSRSDTEVFLRMLARRGTAALDDVNGMFAFAWWDADARRLVLGRDRFGEKPLFYAQHNAALWFASEEKALFAAGVPRAFDADTWSELLLFRHIAGERTTYEGVRRLLPGHVLEISAGGVHARRWWSGPDPDAASSRPSAFRSLLDDAVRLRMQADVPVGVMLSGGLDSSSIATLSARTTPEPVHAFTVRYPGHRMDEGNHARLVATAAGLHHHEIEVRPGELPSLLEETTRLRGAPIAHSATTHLLALSRVAREHVKVLLSGEGADELLGGYGRYQPYRLGPALGAAAFAARRLPRGARVQAVLQTAGHPRHERVLFGGAHIIPGVETGDGFAYRRELAATASNSHAHGVRQMMWYEQHTHLQALLEHADRATMGAGIECRLPFLDASVANAAAGASTRSLYGRHGKRLLRRAMARDLPAAVLRRQKQGWSAPWQRYLRDVPQLRELVRSLPSNPIVRASPIPQALIDDTVRRFLAGEPGTFDLVWLLTRVAVWHEVCVNGRRVLT